MVRNFGVSATIMASCAILVSFSLLQGCGLTAATQSPGSASEANVAASSSFATVAALPVYIWNPKTGLRMQCSAGASPVNGKLRLYTAAHCFYAIKKTEGEKVFVPVIAATNSYPSNLKATDFEAQKAKFIEVTIEEGGTFCKFDVAYRSLNLDQASFENAVKFQANILNTEQTKGATLKLAQWVDAGDTVRYSKSIILKTGSAGAEFPKQEIFEGEGVVSKPGSSGGIVFKEIDKTQVLYGVLLGSMPTTPEGTKEAKCADSKLRVIPVSAAESSDARSKTRSQRCNHKDEEREETVYGDFDLP